MHPVRLSIILLVTLAACGKASDEPKATPTPVAPVAPPPSVEQPPERAPGMSPGELAAMAEPGKQALLQLALIVDGKPARATREQVDALPTMTIRGDQGDERVVWSVRDLVAAVAGEGARPLRVVGEGDPVEIDPAAWANPEHTPILRTNRRGELRFQWLGPDGNPREANQARAVERIELAK